MYKYKYIHALLYKTYKYSIDIVFHKNHSKGIVYASLQVNELYSIYMIVSI